MKDDFKSLKKFVFVYFWMKTHAHEIRHGTRNLKNLWFFVEKQLILLIIHSLEFTGAVFGVSAFSICFSSSVSLMGSVTCTFVSVDSILMGTS